MNEIIHSSRYPKNHERHGKLFFKLEIHTVCISHLHSKLMTYQISGHLEISAHSFSSMLLVRTVIYIQTEFALVISAGIPFVRSANNVILSAGNKDGVIPKEFFKTVVQRNNSKALLTQS